jgi:hypothetical protein
MTTITVTAADIEPHSHSCTCCPTALAITRVVRSGITVSVGCEHYDLICLRGDLVTLDLPINQIVRIDRFDRTNEMEPHTFDLDIPAEFLAKGD